MIDVDWDHLQIFAQDPESMAQWFRTWFNASFHKTTTGRIDVTLAGVQIFIAKPSVTTTDTPRHPHNGFDHIGLKVQNLESAAQALREGGVQFTSEPKEIRPGVRMCFIEGPEGISIELLERSGPQS